MTRKCHYFPFPSKGFTLVELVMVVILIGILAAVVVPRFAEQTVFDRRGFGDETRSILRFAQKTAVAQRRNVCVSFSANSVTLMIDGASPAAGLSTCSGATMQPLTGPNGSAPYTITAKGEVVYSPVPANFQFIASGQASNSQTIQIQGAATAIRVEGATGYVH